MAGKARRQIQRAEEGKIRLVVLPVIVAETFYTLESYYEVNRQKVATLLFDFLQSRGIEAMELERNAHFADAYLAAASVELESAVVSFDRDFGKFADVRRIEPGD